MGWPGDRQERPQRAAADKVHPVTAAQLQIGDIAVDVTRKNVRSIRLVVSPPDGQVRVSVPRRVNLELVHAFVVAKLAWIRKQQERMRSRISPAQPDYVDGELHP